MELARNPSETPPRYQALLIYAQDKKEHCRWAAEFGSARHGKAQNGRHLSSAAGSLSHGFHEEGNVDNEGGLTSDYHN